MVEWDSQIILLKDKSKYSLVDMEIEYSNCINELQHKRNVVALTLQSISNAKNETWEELKTGTEHALNELRAIFFNSVTKLI